MIKKVMIKHMLKLPYISLFFSMVSMIILNIFLYKYPKLLSIMQAMFWIYNSLQIQMFNAFLNMVDGYVGLTKKQLIELHLKRDELMKRERKIMYVFLALTTISLICSFFGKSVSEVISMGF